MMFKNRTKVIQHLITNSTKYKWRFDINTKIFESLNIKDCVKNVLKWIESLVNPLFVISLHSKSRHSVEIKTNKDNRF